jgi:hypothetical protein
MESDLVLVYTDIICEKGELDVLMHVPSDDLLLLFFMCNRTMLASLPMYLIQDISGLLCLSYDCRMIVVCM